MSRARDLSERSYKAGATTLSDLLTVDRQLLSAKEELDDAKARAARAAVALFRALGGGWTPEGAGEPSGLVMNGSGVARN
ncbi:TolC family protein [Paucibacter sp. R3-3]|uniref:TolC family protein n=1 Tax=Roseateles agri TaxID=3098619 RepID=A0ABU5DQW9_9BURK|nr:TolC family protein [Paucibacter sp. R3-3]MDY0748717.1 TolC family protein [Paucibacter sp. R3-3]